MDLETKLTDAYTYTLNELEKNLALAEVHAKQFETDPFFCSDCLRKHFILIEGLADEGINFTDNISEKMKFQKISQIMKLFKSKLPEINKDVAYEMADKLRIIRKSLHSSPIILEIIASNPTEKDLNSPNSKYNIKGESKRGIIMEIKQLGIVTGSQFVGRGIQEAEAYVPGEIVPGVSYATVINVVGGLGAMLATLWGRTPESFKLPLAVVGSKLLADEIVNQAKKMTAAAPAYVPRYAPVSFAPSFAPSAELVKID